MAMAIKIEEIEEISPEKILTEEDKILENKEFPVPGSSGTSNSPNKPVPDPKPFKCPMFQAWRNPCLESFESVDLVNQHYILVHSKPKAVPNQGWALPKPPEDSSDTLFVGNPSDNQNIESGQKVQWPNRFGKRPKFSCCDCSYVGKNKSDITNHRKKVHLTEKKFKCDQCSYKTQYSTNLRIHKERVYHTVTLRRLTH